MNYMTQIIYFLCTGLTKLCFLFFFLRIFPLKVVRIWCYIGIGLSVAYIAGFGSSMVFACWPISCKTTGRRRAAKTDQLIAIWTAWSTVEDPKYCIDQNIFFYTGSGADISIDILIALIPFPHLWRLKLSMKKKLMLIAIFSVGFV